MGVNGAEAARWAPLVDRGLLIRVIIGVVLLVVAVVLMGWVFRDPITDLARAFVDRLGLAGVFFGMLLVDSYAFPPLAHEPVLFFAYAGELGFVETCFVAGLGSFLAGPVGYAIGRGLRRLLFVRRMLRRFGLTKLMRRRGVWVVVVAAVSPLPFSAASYAAGAMRVPFGPFLLACTLRFPKVALYLGMIAFGWSLG